jgi:hypothetical protein
MRVHMSVYLPESLHQQVTQEARERGISLSAFVNCALMASTEEFQRWLENRFQRLEMLFAKARDGR